VSARFHCQIRPFAPASAHMCASTDAWAWWSSAASVARVHQHGFCADSQPQSVVACMTCIRTAHDISTCCTPACRSACWLCSADYTTQHDVQVFSLTGECAKVRMPSGMMSYARGEHLMQLMEEREPLAYDVEPFYPEPLRLCMCNGGLAAALAVDCAPVPRCCRGPGECRSPPPPPPLPPCLLPETPLPAQQAPMWA
jgi:hypothetical protein